MSKIKILSIYTEYRINGLMRFIRDLYEGNCFNLKIRILDQLQYLSTGEAKNQKGKNSRKLFKEYITYQNPNIVHIKIYSIDQKLLKFLEEHKKEMI